VTDFGIHHTCKKEKKKREKEKEKGEWDLFPGMGEGGNCWADQGVLYLWAFPLVARVSVHPTRMHPRDDHDKFLIETPATCKERNVPGYSQRKKFFDVVLVPCLH